MKRRWYPPRDSTTYAHIRADKLPPIGSVIAFNHRALEILRYDERDDGWIAQVLRIHGPRLKSENDRAECGLRLRNFAILDVYKGRIPLCSCCGSPLTRSRSPVGTHCPSGRETSRLSLPLSNSQRSSPSDSIR